LLAVHVPIARNHWQITGPLTQGDSFRPSLSSDQL
jgi:hypothetical protein